MLDQTGSLALLEADLNKLPLRYYQNLYEPAYELVPLLQVISRCKDELITPFSIVSQRMRRSQLPGRRNSGNLPKSAGDCGGVSDL